MGQGQRIEAKRSGGQRTSLSASSKSKSRLIAPKMHFGNRYFWPSYDARKLSKALIQPGKVKGSIKRAFEPTFIFTVLLKMP